MDAINRYSYYLSNLRTAKKLGLPAPHKAILLLSVKKRVDSLLLSQRPSV